MPLEDIAPEILDFVDRYIDRFVAWDLLAYFHENPAMERKLSAIAGEIGRKSSAIEPCLEQFVEQGVLAREPDEAGEPSYRYVATTEFKAGMETFLLATQDRTNRLAIVSRVLQKETRRL